MVKASASFQGTYSMPSVVWLDYLWEYTIISWLREKQSNYCPELVEKAEGNNFPDLLLYRGIIFDCFPSSHEVTVLLPNRLKTTQHCQQYADASLSSTSGIQDFYQFNIIVFIESSRLALYGKLFPLIDEVMSKPQCKSKL